MGKIIVVYGGGFQPFHAGHLSSYLEAKEAFPNADFYVAASNDTKTRPIPFTDKQFLAQQAGVRDPFVQVRMPINPAEILDRYSPKQDIFILVRSERDPVGYTKKDGSPGYFQPFTDISKCEPFGYHGYVFVTHKKEFKLNGQVVYSGTQVRDMYANSDDQGRMNIIKQLYPQSSDQGTIKQMLDKYIGSVEPTVEPDKSAIKQLKAKKLKEQIQRMRPLIKEASIEQKYKMLKLIKEATQLDELNLFGKKIIGKDKLPQKPQPTSAEDDYRSYFKKSEPGKPTGKVYRNPDEYYNQTKKDPLAAKDKDIAEEVNPDVTSDEYFIEPTENVRMGDFVFNARTFSGALGDQNARGLQIRAYDPKNLKRSIGSADFIVKKDKKGNTWLESDDTEVDELYRSKGIAAMMYAFAKTLGNDIKRSPYQSKAGSDMWNKWGSDADNLMKEENPNQQLALYKPDGKTYRGSHNKMPTLDNPDDIYNKANRYDFDDTAELPDELSDEPNMDDSIKELIKSKLDELEPRERKILQLRYWHDMTAAEIADRLNISQSRILQIEARAMRKIKTATLDFNPDALKMYVPESLDYIEEK